MIFSPSPPIRGFSAVSDDATLISFVAARAQKGDDDFPNVVAVKRRDSLILYVSPLPENLIPGNPGV